MMMLEICHQNLYFAFLNTVDVLKLRILYSILFLSKFLYHNPHPPPPPPTPPPPPPHTHTHTHTHTHDSGGVLWFQVGRLCVCPSVSRILFPDDNLSKHQWIFTNFGMCIDIVEIWFGIANGQILSNFVCPRQTHIFIPG